MYKAILLAAVQYRCESNSCIIGEGSRLRVPEENIWTKEG
jgi:hypothetical protein